MQQCFYNFIKVGDVMHYFHRKRSLKNIFENVVFLFFFSPKGNLKVCMQLGIWVFKHGSPLNHSERKKCARAHFPLKLNTGSGQRLKRLAVLMASVRWGSLCPKVYSVVWWEHWHSLSIEWEVAHFYMEWHGKSIEMWKNQQQTLLMVRKSKS